MKIYWSFFLVLLAFSSLLAQEAEEEANSSGLKAPKLGIRGNLWSQAGFYQAQGIPARTNTFIWSMGGSAVASLDQWEMPFSFTIGQYGSQLSKPTFGQLGISPTHKWAKFHLGHRNLHFSSYTLSGHTFLGAGVELNPKKFRFAAMAGRLRQVVRPQENLANLLPTYRRMGMGIKVGIGTAEEYLDLIVFRAKDDAKSLLAPQDSSLQPAENIVFGVNSRVKMTPHLTAHVDGGISMFNRNLNSATLPNSEVKPYEQWPDQLLPLRYSSRISFAGKAMLTYQKEGFQLGLQYERIDPQYESMGTFFFLNDLENITLAPVFSMLKGKINVSGQLGVQRNNLLDNRSESTNRWIGNTNISYQNGSQPFGVSLNYSNFTIQQNDGRLELSDTIRLSMVTSSLSVNPYWNWISEASTKSITMSGNYQDLNDRNPFTREFTDMQSIFFTAMYHRTSNTNGWGFSLGAQYNTLQVFNLDTDRYGLTGGVQRNFQSGKYQLSANSSYNLARIGGESDGLTLSNNLNANWAVGKRVQLSLYANHLYNRSEQFDSYTEWIGGFRLGWQWR